ncbi:MAG TPA: L-histidine N(alpha)-methyltransferase [Candidatus Tectomicrobia bacterium]|nr:L-histidine N(alpha)-methyltransferase [Candidatus Tectomicrobia bacterium]
MQTEALPDKRLRFHFTDVQAHQHLFAQDVAYGLAAPQKWLPPKYFYDERGSQLYERICALPEYYPYRSEAEILSTYAAEIHAEIGHLALVEFGSGSATKTRHLLSAYEWAGQPFRYCPVDISRQILWDTANRLVREYSHIEIRAMHADFAGQPEVIQAFELEKKAVAFLGSSLGNLTPDESVQFLQRTAAMMGPEDAFLLGIDLKKSPAILLPAYDDAQGVTAAFNLNVLHRINRELGGQFEPQSFDHLALYNEAQGRIEMHLRSRRAQRVRIARIERVVSFGKDETIHTESSYKYSLDEVRDLGYQANLVLRRTWFDQRRYFLLALFRPR